jgi:large conductance mechanosensitive channel protein
MREIHKKTKELQSKNFFADLVFAVIFALAFFSLIVSLVENILMPGLSILLGNKIEDMTMRVKGDIDYGQNSIKHYGLFISNILILILILFFIWVCYLVYKRIERKNKMMSSIEPQELSTGDLLHVEMRDLLKNLVEIRDLLEEQKKK